MGRIKAFPYVFFHSLTSIEYYKEILKTKKSFTTKYFVALSALASLVITFAVSAVMTPAISSTIKNALDQFENMYPDDLVITSKDNTWQLNKPEPLIMEFPLFGDYMIDMPQNFIVFDKKGIITDLEKYDTMILVNEKNILVEGNERIETYPIKGMPEGEFTKERLSTALDNLVRYTALIQLIFVLVLGFFVLVYNYMFKLGHLFVLAALLWLFCVAADTKFKYTDLFRIALHTMTLPTVLELAIVSSGVNTGIPLVVWFFGLNLIYAVAVILALTKSGYLLKKK